jgi:hypothetical protein
VKGPAGNWFYADVCRKKSIPASEVPFERESKHDFFSGFKKEIYYMYYDIVHY